MLHRFSVILLTVTSVVGCGANLYGHSRKYEMLAAEATALRGATEFDPVMAKRFPEEWRKKTVSVFGIVTKRDDDKNGSARVTISVRTLEARNLCENISEDSCRTTVSEHEFDQLYATLSFTTAEDEFGETSIGIGSLLRLVGTIAEKPNNDDGGMILNATYYRHWPRGYYVTTASASMMRR